VGDAIPVSGYATDGTADLAELAIETLGDQYDACLLKAHGTIAVGESPEAAFETSLMVEYCARIHYQAPNIGDSTLLPDEEIDTLTVVSGITGRQAIISPDCLDTSPRREGRHCARRHRRRRGDGVGEGEDL
jgi:L-fuculose-phosphate aldolase